MNYPTTLSTGILLATSLIQNSFAATPPTEVLAFKEKNMKSLMTSSEYQPEIWEKATHLVIQSEDAPLFTALLGARIKGGIQRANQRFRLFDIYREKPGFFVQEAKKFLHGSLDCVVASLAPRSQVLNSWDIEKVALAAEKNGTTTRELIAFQARVREHSAKLKAGTDNLDLTRCE